MRPGSSPQLADRITFGALSGSTTTQSGSVLTQAETAVSATSGNAALATADLLYQGEFLGDGQPLAAARQVATPREFAGYTLGYNHSLFAQRTHDILTLVAFCRSYAPHPPRRLSLAATGGAGPWAAAALAQIAAAQTSAAQSSPILDRAVIDTRGFRFAQVQDLKDVNFLPGSVKYGDLPAMLALAAPTPLWLSGEEGKLPDAVRASYTAAGAIGAVVSSAEPATPAADAAQPDEARWSEALTWLMQPPAAPAGKSPAAPTPGN